MEGWRWWRDNTPPVSLWLDYWQSRGLMRHVNEKTCLKLPCPIHCGGSFICTGCTAQSSRLEEHSAFFRPTAKNRILHREFSKQVCNRTLPCEKRENFCCTCIYYMLYRAAQFFGGYIWAHPGFWTNDLEVVVALFCHSIRGTCSLKKKGSPLLGTVRTVAEPLGAQMGLSDEKISLKVFALYTFLLCMSQYSEADCLWFPGTNLKSDLNSFLEGQKWRHLGVGGDYEC